MEEKHITSSRGKTCYWISKRESSLCLVFLPGLSADHRLFDSQVDAFSRKHRVLVWDAPAHGASRPYRDFSYTHAAGELKAILDAEQLDRVVLVGQSAGGFTAQIFYEKYPDLVAGMVFIGSCPISPAYYSRWDLFWLKQTKWMFPIFPDGILQRAMAAMCGSTRSARENMLAMLSAYSKEELCHLLHLGFAGFLPEIRSLEIRCPVLLLVGARDRTGKVMTYNRGWHRREGFPLHILENASHNANADCPEQTNRLLKAFLQTL